MINTVLFDMDGLLLDTEQLWGESMRRVAEAHRIPITSARFKETTGLRIYEVTEYWSRVFPWEGRSADEVAEEILDDIIALSKARGGVMEGVMPLLDLLEKHDYKVGLATSSPKRMAYALLDHFDLLGRFTCITSADAVSYGKPHPAVFLHCAENMDSPPHQCLVLEDSVNGCIAGKAARMKVIAVPDELHWDDPRFTIADMKLRSLAALDEATLMIL